MPIKNIINDSEKIVYSICNGEMSLDDFKVYVDSVWRDARCYGYNELFDTRQADWENFDFTNLFVVASDAARLGTLDPYSKLAWLVLEGKQKALTDFYKNAKALLPVNSRKMQAFFSEQEAIEWLSG